MKPVKGGLPTGIFMKSWLSCRNLNEGRLIVDRGGGILHHVY
jgi:hypothetical protein